MVLKVAKAFLVAIFLLATLGYGVISARIVDGHWAGQDSLLGAAFCLAMAVVIWELPVGSNK
ncbi:MAG TPA: hypothetical protein VG944_01655 [Fimbriimonas sp.]|nr:hypothetical protein [Fimbriimonas sp.]